MANDNRQERTIKSNVTLFTIIDVLQRNEGAGVTEIAQEMNVAKSGVHKHLTTLLEQGFVTKQEGEYCIGLRFLDIGIWARNQTDLYPASKSKVEEVAQETKEQAWCIVEENGLGVFIAGAIGEHKVRSAARIGKRMNLHYVSGGKAILAHLPQKRVESIIDHHGLSARTEHTITDEEELFDELEEIRQRGFAINTEEAAKGVHAIGTHIENEQGEPIGALCVAGAANRVTEQRCTNEISDIILAAANEIELNLAFP